MRIWQTLQRVDRRVIYTLIFISVAIPIIWPLQLPTAITPGTRAFFDTIEAIPDGSRVMFPVDVWPSTLAETEPMIAAGLRHCFRKNLRVIGLSNVAMGGPLIAERVLKQVGDEFGKTYGMDYVNLGYKANYQAVMLGMATRIADIYPTDHSGTRLEDLPLMREVPNYDSLGLIVIVSDNAMVDYWVSLVNARFGKPMVAGVTAVMAPKSLSYIQTGQLSGLLGGMKGAAEYEQLLNAKGWATRGMDSQSLIHLLIISFIILGNVAYFASRSNRDSGVRA